jgi:hypothetical protein
MQDVMLDLETFGTSPGCVIRSIGAVVFDPKTGQLGPEFYANVDRNSCEFLGMTVDASTEAWWKRQSLAAQAALLKDPVPLHDALRSFSVWWSTYGGERVWSHGANFDQPIMEAAYPLVGMQAPWSFWNSRCTRTLFDIAGVDTRKMSAGEVKHNALDDARIQARAVHLCFQRLGQAAPVAVVPVPAAPILNTGDVFA